MPGGPRGLQNRRRHASGEVGSIPILSASLFAIFDFPGVRSWSQSQIAIEYQVKGGDINVTRADS